MRLFVLNALVCAILTCSQASFADDLYRCGNGYQDKPCKGKAGRHITTKKVPHTVRKVVNESQADSATNPNCQQRGEAAKAIAKQRESGKTQDQQINATTDVASQTLIKEVYSRRGNSVQIQYAFEHECMQLIEKDRLMNKQMAESERLRHRTASRAKNNKSKVDKTPIEQAGQLLTPSQATTPVQTEKTVPVTHPATTTATTEPKAVKTKPVQKPQDEGDELGICRSFRAGIANIDSQKLKGGDAAHMKDLNQQQEHLKQEMKSAGC